MNVTREVILDLLPLYLAGEASTETQSLVKEYLENDPDLKRLAQQWQERLPGPPPAAANPDAQALAFHEAKRQIALRTVVLAVVITVGILAMTALVGLMFYFPA